MSSAATLSNRMATYIALKRSAIDEIRRLVTPALKSVVNEIVAVPTQYPRKYMQEDSLLAVLQELVPSGIVTIGLSQPHPHGFADEIASILDQYKGNIGLEIAWVNPYPGNHDILGLWTCLVRFTCPPWQQLFEAKLGFRAELMIEAVFGDDGCHNVGVCQIEYFELADLLMLKLAAEEYWTLPNEWIAWRKSTLVEIS